MKFPKNVILESVAERKNHSTYGLEFIQELGNDDAGYFEMIVVIFKYKKNFIVSIFNILMVRIITIIGKTKSNVLSLFVKKPYNIIGPK